MAARGGLVLALFATLSLAGCGAWDQASEKLASAGITTKFGKPTRDRISRDASGTTVRMMIESRAVASWSDASIAISMGLPYTCRDGESFFYVSQTPEGMEGGTEAYEREHPAGTTFTQVIKCNPPPPYEFALTAGTREEDAFEQVRAQLQGADEADPDRFIVRTLYYHDRSPKYPEIARSLGYSLGHRMSNCPSGFSVRRMIVAAHPRPDMSARDSLNRSYVVLGIDAPCLDAGQAAGASQE